MPPIPMSSDQLPSSDYEMGAPICDQDESGVCDVADYDFVSSKIGLCVGHIGFAPAFDYDVDGCLTNEEITMIILAEPSQALMFAVEAPFLFWIATVRRHRERFR